MTTDTKSQLATILEQNHLTVSEQDVQSHVMLPSNVSQSRSARETATPQQTPIPHITPHHVYAFDGGGFCNALHNDLKSLVAGYTMRMRQHGLTIYTLEWNWAKEPQDGGEGWTPEIRMHVASCSKIITAIAMTKLLDERRLGFDTKIIDYLPRYWVKGPGVDQVTIANLLTHTSGFHFNQDETPSDYMFMKQQIAAGTTKVGTYNYQNMNFGLCRILLSTINGNIPVTMTSPILEDSIWDAVTLQDYQAYCTANVFGPGKVSDASLAHADGDALAYNFPVTGKGWNSGDLTSVAGGAGWHLSVDDLLGVMSAFRREGSIVSSSQAQASLDAGYGIDWKGQSPLGTYYAKNGAWGSGASQVEQCVAFYLPQDIELVVFVNSPIGTAPEFLMGQVLQHYLDNVK